MLSLRFARRYLFSRKSHSVINLISGVSVVAVAMPVAAMIILLSVFNGFEGLVRSMATAFDADLVITPSRGSTMVVESVDTTALRHIEGVEALSWVVEQEALLSYRDRQATVVVRGVEPNYPELFPVHQTISQGEYRVELGDYDYAVLGQGLAYALGVRSLVAGDVELYALRANSFSTLLPMEGYTRRILPIAGCFQLDAETEGGYLLTSIRLARELFSMEGRATSLLLKLDGAVQPERAKRAVAEVLGEEFEVRTRYELKKTFYDIMTYEKWGIFFISLLVLVIASFSIVGALVMLIIEKRDEELTLRSMGADTDFIRRIFQGEGLLIGGIGALLGVVLGVGVTLLQEHLALIKMPVETFIMDAYPVEFRWGDLAAVLLVFGVVLLLISTLTVSSMIKKRG